MVEDRGPTGGALRPAGHLSRPPAGVPAILRRLLRAIADQDESDTTPPARDAGFLTEDADTEN